MPNTGAPSQATAVWTLIVAVVIVAVVPHIPIVKWIGQPLLWLSTLAHEGGHGLTALAVGADFERLDIWPNGSGMAHSVRGVSPLRAAAISLGGLIGPAVVAMVLLVVGASRRLSRGVLMCAGIAAMATAVLVARGFGFVVAAGWGVALTTAGALLTGERARLAVLVLAVNLSASVFSRGDYLFTDVARTGAGESPSDVARIAERLGGVYWMWGSAIAMLSVGLLAVGVGAFFAADATRARHGARAPPDIDV